MSTIRTVRNTSNNVVVFPKSKDGVPPQTVEELKKKLTSSRVEIAGLLAEELTKEILRIMDDNGYHIENVKDITFLLLTIKSILLRYENVEYSLQQIIDEQINLIDSSEELNEE